MRVIEYEVPDREGDGTGELIALITTITDPRQAPAAVLAADSSGNGFGHLAAGPKGLSLIRRCECQHGMTSPESHARAVAQL